MDFGFSPEEEEFRRSVRHFCESKIAPLSDEIDEKGEIPRSLISEMGAFGLLGITVSKDYGGTGSDFMKAAIAAEEIARADTSMAVAVYYLVEAGWGFLFERYGTEKAKNDILPKVTRGESFLGIASTEATGGSDIASTSTSLVRSNGRLTVRGTKTYISGVREAAESGGGYVTVVKTGPDLGHKGLSLCYLPVGEKTGVEVIASRQMGREGISNGFIRIDGAEIPDDYLIGEWNRGFYYAMEGFNCARTLVAAACIGAAAKTIETGIAHIKRRKVFGSPLGKFEGIQFQLAEDYAKLESARMLVCKAAWMLDRFYQEDMFSHEEINTAVAVAKLTSPQAAFEIIKDVMVWHGAYGYTREAGIEKGLRGVASYIVGAEGTMNVMKVIIGKGLLGKDYTPV
ncbi:MAG: acyl-CoA/acyl-ACP dehydrogenase [Candidatus Sulfobium sp.]|jgi:acyl-CoA dehydrogenase